MKLKGYMSGVVAAGLVGLASLASCNDQWNDHYEGTGGVGVPGMSLMDLLREDSRLTRFCEMLEKTHEDTRLSSSQTYTVWAPQDEALADVDMDDMDALRRVVYNHIARYTNPSSTSPEKKIYMLNNKLMSYESATQYMNAPIAESDLLARNGVLHVLKEQITYRPNVMEWMASAPDYSKVYEFVNRWSRKQYDASLSTTYDSVFVDYNPMLESLMGIGLLAAEDSLYTMVIPDNAAWDAAMTRLKPYFMPASTLTGEALTAYQDSVCESRAGQAILSGLTFPGRYFRDAEGEFAEPVAYDSIFTVDRHVLYKENLRTYFSGYERKEASNGYVYLAKGNLNMADTCTWNPIISIEGENTTYVTPDVGMTTAVRTVTPTDNVRGVSGGAYREFTAKSNTQGVTVETKQALCSGTYEIWVDYVPPVIDNLKKKTRLQYTVTYLLENGEMLATPEEFKDDGLIVQNASEYEEEDGVLIVPEKEGVVTQKVGEVTFKTADYYDPMWYFEEKNGSTTPTYNTKITITPNLTRSESRNPAEWEMTVRFDRIRLVPVLE